MSLVLVAQEQDPSAAMARLEVWERKTKTVIVHSFWTVFNGSTPPLNASQICTCFLLL